VEWTQKPYVEADPPLSSNARCKIQAAITAHGGTAVDTVVILANRETP